MAVSDGKGAGGELIRVVGASRALLIAGAVAIPGMIVTLVLVIWAITST
ncbi:MAG: hypothetical protein ABI317_13105 [Gaiellales bacterium]